MTDSPRVRAAGSVRTIKPFAVPAAPAPPLKTSRHGTVLTDEFAWLKDPNWQRVMRDPRLLDPTIRKHLENENRYADDVLASTGAAAGSPDRGNARAHQRGRCYRPAADGAFAYFTRYRDGGQHPSVCREPRGGGVGEVLIDGDALALGKAFFRLGATRIRLITGCCMERRRDGRRAFRHSGARPRPHGGIAGRRPGDAGDVV